MRDLSFWKKNEKKRVARTQNNKKLRLELMLRSQKEDRGGKESACKRVHNLVATCDDHH
jgi:hypothetical protein